VGVLDRVATLVSMQLDRPRSRTRRIGKTSKMIQTVLLARRISSAAGERRSRFRSADQAHVRAEKCQTEHVERKAAGVVRKAER